jgi:hypothetical protein
MRIEALWQEMEREARTGSHAAWLVRNALPRLTQPLLVALEIATNRRALLLAIPETALPARRHWPQCRGLEVLSAVLAGQSHFGVRLRDSGFADVFTALAEDVAPRVAVAANVHTAVAVLLSRLRRWQKFLVAGMGGLSGERQRGLYGELHVLGSHLLPSMSPLTAVFAWRGPKGANQDFQFPAGALEVKTTIAKQPQVVRIASERQLDDTGIPALFLHVVVLDEREVEDASPAGGENLPGIVDSLRQRLNSEEQAAETFEDLLLDAGYLRVDVPRYESRRFTIRGEKTFHVRRGFPRMIEKDMSVGIGDVSYSLSLAACEPFAEPTREMVAMFQVADDRRESER